MLDGLRRALTLNLAAALILLSPGLDAHRAFAATVKTAPRISAPTLPTTPGVSAVPSLSAPKLGLPAASAVPTLGAPVLAPSVQAPAAAPAAAGVAAQAEAITAAVAPHIEAINAPSASADASASAGASIEAALTGQQTSQGASFADPVAGSVGSGAGSLGRASVSAPQGSGSQVPAPKPSSVDDRKTYQARRSQLNKIGAATGVVGSLPVAGPKLSAELIDEAGTKKVIFTDFDDTLGPYNSVLTPEMVAAIVAVKKAGKTVIVVTDRGDVKRPGSSQLTIFESLASIPASDRAGMYVAANNGGRLYKLDEKGEPVKLYEVPSMSEEMIGTVHQAVEALRIKLAELGTAQHPGDALNPAESLNPYGYAMMLKVGTDEATLKKAAKIFEAELAARGIETEVHGKFPKDLKNPPYITFSIMNKSVPVAWFAKELKIRAEDAVAIGDAAYMPRHPDEPTTEQIKAQQDAEALAGFPLPKTGNETDRNMEKGLPGMLMLSVGRTADPRMRNGWALEQKGAEASIRVFQAMAKPQAEQPMTKWETLGTGLFLAAGLAGSFYTLYLLYSSMAQAIFNQPPVQLPEGWQGPVPDINDIFQMMSIGAAGFLGMIGRPNVMPNPSAMYARAADEAAKLAVKRGYEASQVRFVSATASLPRRDGAEWKFAFQVSREADPKAADMVYVDFFSGFSSGWDTKVSLFQDVAVPEGRVTLSLSPAVFNMGTRVAPEQALDAVNRELPGFGRAVSVSAELVAEPVSNDTDVWYKFFNNAGDKAAVNARTGEVRVVAAAVPAAPAQNLTTAQKIGVGLLIAGLVAAAVMYLNFAMGMMGLGLLGMAGTLKGKGKAEKAAVTDEQIEAAARSVASSKGGVWSHTEYNMAYSNTYESLKKAGATEAQLKRFQELCDAAPVIGGRFNPWSGD